MTHTLTEPAPTSLDHTALSEVRAWLRGVDEPFPGARAALEGQDAEVVSTGRLGSPNSSFDIYGAVRQLAASPAENDRPRSLVVLLEGPLTATARSLEDRLWHTLQHLSDFDDGPWDDTVVTSLDRAEHAFSVDGEPWSVELLHPQSPESARRAPWPVLVVRPLPAPH